MTSSLRFAFAFAFAFAVSGVAACGASATDPAPALPTSDDPGRPARPAAQPAPAAPQPPAAGSPTAPVVVPLPAVPLHTDGRWIVDKNGKRFKLASVNWYGAEGADHVVAGLDVAKLDDIAAFIAKAGFNSVRLPWSNELYETNPLVASPRLAANPALQGMKGMDVLDAVIDALAKHGLVVVLDNHVSRADWCCSATDGNGLWFDDAYPESSWLADWTGIVTRYKRQAAVVGVDLRNELRAMPDGRTATWAGSNPVLDWRRASMAGGDAVLAANPELLVVIEGLHYATDLTGFGASPPVLSVPHRIVYSAHDYSWFHAPDQTFDGLHTALGDSWGYLLTQGRPFTGPVWIGELGTHHDAANVDADSGPGLWFRNVRKYVADADIDWSYWALNGTQATGTTRTLGAEEGFGILDTTWTQPAFAGHLGALAALMPATQGPK